MMVQCVTAAGLFGAGDVIAQQLVEKKGLRGHDVSTILPPRDPCSFPSRWELAPVLAFYTLPGRQAWSLSP